MKLKRFTAASMPSRSASRQVGSSTGPFLIERTTEIALHGRMATSVPAHITGTVWKIQKKVGEAVAAGEVLIILESMKMEMELESPVAGTVAEIRCQEGQAVAEGDVLVVIS
jgi:acetyl-CoA carboxylase biotin carboxyl carrier protein